MQKIYIYIYTHTHTTCGWTDTTDWAVHSMPAQGCHYGDESFLEYSFRSFSSQSCHLTVGSLVQWKARGLLLVKFSCYITQLGSNTRTLGSMKTASWFWVGQRGSSAAQGSFAAARQTLRHVGESDLVWLFVFLNCCLDIICDMTCHVTHR